MTTRRRSTAAAILAALLLGTAPLAQAAEPSPEVRARIVALSTELLDAIAPGKAEVWERILDEDATVVDEFGRRQDKREAVKAIRPLPPGFTGSIQLVNPHVHQYGDTAVIDCEADERESVFGQALAVRYLFLATFVRRAGEWRLVAMEDVTLPADPPPLPVAGLSLDDYPGAYAYGPGRAFVVGRAGDGLTLATRAGGPAFPLRPVARDVFTDGGEEKNLIVFQRNAAGRVTALIERRKHNDLRMQRVEAGEAPRPPT